MHEKRHDFPNVIQKNQDSFPKNPKHFQNIHKHNPEKSKLFPKNLET